MLLVAPDVARVLILRDETGPNAGGNETAERLMPPVASGSLSKTSQQSRAEKTHAGRHVCNCNSEKRSLYRRCSPPSSSRHPDALSDVRF